MPVLINEVIADVQAEVTPQHESQPLHAQSAVSDPEYQLTKMVSLIEERRARLAID